MNTPSNKANHYKLLFICLGNICRSPAADAVMHRLVESKELSHSLRYRILQELAIGMLATYQIEECANMEQNAAIILTT